MKHNFDKICPKCRTIGEVESKDGRNMFYCPTCLLSVPLIYLKYYESTTESSRADDLGRNG